MGGSQSGIKSKCYDKCVEDLPSTEGNVLVITGTTTGIGFHTVRGWMKKGGGVVCLNRASDRVEKMLLFLKEEFPSGSITNVECDLQNFSSVRKACDEVTSLCGEEGIDVLCNSAGIMAMSDTRTVDGYDVQMQTNHLSHFILSRALLPLLEKRAAVAGEARLINVSSKAREAMGKNTGKLEAKYFAKTPAGELGGDGNSMLFGGARWIRYHQTKVANVVFTTALHNRLVARCSKVRAAHNHNVLHYPPAA
jgi:NAD(P)-dependent dehydrogenase (short-subunit alcohol dehydrogenase family)